MIVFGIKNCDSVKKALRFFSAHNIDYTFSDLRINPVDDETIARWIGKGAAIDTLLNKRGTTYRQLKLKERNLSDDEKPAWLALHNMLIKRPVIEMEKRVIIGFNETQYEGDFLA